MPAPDPGVLGPPVLPGLSEACSFSDAPRSSPPPSSPAVDLRPRGSSSVDSLRDPDAALGDVEVVGPPVVEASSSLDHGEGRANHPLHLRVSATADDVA